jgi:hypothetical protein
VSALTLEAVRPQRTPGKNFVCCWASSLFPHHELSPLASAVNSYPYTNEQVWRNPTAVRKKREPAAPSVRIGLILFIRQKLHSRWSLSIAFPHVFAPQNVARRARGLDRLPDIDAISGPIIDAYVQREDSLSAARSSALQNAETAVNTDRGSNGIGGARARGDHNVARSGGRIRAVAPAVVHSPRRDGDRGTVTLSQCCRKVASKTAKAPNESRRATAPGYDPTGTFRRASVVDFSPPRGHRISMPLGSRPLVRTAPSWDSARLITGLRSPIAVKSHDAL